MLGVSTSPTVAETVAPLVEALFGPDTPVRVEFWDGSDSVPRCHQRRARSVSIQPMPCDASCGARTSSAWPGRSSSGDLDADGDLFGMLKAMLRVTRKGMRLGWSALPDGLRAARTAGAGRAPAATAAGGGSPARRAALAPPRRRGDRSPLRRRQRLLPDRARPVDDVLVRPLRRGGDATSPRRRRPSTS